MTMEAAAQEAARVSAENGRVRKHALYSLAGFIALGFALEFALGFRVRFVVDGSQETTRTFLRLAHAHGTLLAIVRLVSLGNQRPNRLVTAAMYLVPAGFFLGALGAREGDPSPLIALVPVGAVLLLVGLVQTARHAE